MNLDLTNQGWPHSLSYRLRFEPKELKDVRISFEVRRGGQMVQREGTIGRVTDKCIWIGAYVYAHTDLHNVEELAK